MVGFACPDEREPTLLPPGGSLSHPAGPGCPRTGGRTQAVEPLPTDVSPVVEGGDGTPGLAQALRGALSVADSVMGEGEDTLGVRGGPSHGPAVGHLLVLALLLHGAGTLAVEVAVLPLVGHHHLVPVDLSGAPGSLRPPGIGALLVPDPLVEEGKHTELAREGGAELRSPVDNPHSNVCTAGQQTSCRKIKS